MKNESQKDLLRADIEKYKSMLDDEVNVKKEVFKKSAIVLGIVTAGFALTKLIISDDKDDEKSIKPSESSGLGKLAMGIITPLAITLAKNQLAGFFDEKIKDETEVS